MGLHLEIRRLEHLALVAAALLAFASPARADLKLCNRTSYVLDLALGLEEKESAATRGWFRVDPGQCRVVLQGAIEADGVFVHSRALDVYGSSPMPQAGHVDLCVADGNFVIAGARSCSARKGQRLVRFTAVKPLDTDQGSSVALAEEAEYGDEQARLAGIQRLLGLAGYDVSPIDGIAGKKTDVALIQFLKDHQLPTEAVLAPSFFELLADAAKRSGGSGFSWCNDTGFTVMAALGLEESGTIVTRGWYRIEPGKCLKPEVAGKPQRLYSFAEAVDTDGQAVKRADGVLSWGGATMLCTRPARFEVNEHTDCVGTGLSASGFALVDLRTADPVLRLREP